MGRTIGLVTAALLTIIGFTFGGLAILNHWNWPIYLWVAGILITAMSIAAFCTDPHQPAPSLDSGNHNRRIIE